MRNSILIILSLISIYTFSNEAIYNGNISVAGNDFFEGYTSSEAGVYLGGSNTFPIGSYVEVKMNHTNVSASIKIVRKIAENGKFILVDKSAGEKLGLSDDDTVMVSIIVKKVIPDPSLALDSLEFDPEPEIKGATSRILSSKTSEPEAAIEREPLTEFTSEEALSEETSENESEEVSEEGEILNEEEPVEVSEEVLEEATEEGEILEVPEVAEVTEVTEDAEDAPSVDPVIPDEIEVENSEEAVEPVYTEEPVGDLDIVEESLYDLDDYEEITIEPTPDEKRVVKRIFYLEPASNKPPVGGKADKELLPVTREDDVTPFIEGNYLQVGIYSTKERLLDGVEKLETYNIPYEEVQAVNGEKKYILLAGPLLNDEIGVVRVYLKDRGFKDFFRYIKK